MRKPVGKRLLPPATVGALPLDSTIPLSAVAVRWNLPVTSIRQVESEARRCGLQSPVSIISPLVSSVPDLGEANASLTAESQDLH